MQTLIFKRLFEPGSVRRYRRYRAAELALNSKIIDSALTPMLFDQVVRELGVGAQRRLELESEGELSVLMDYAFHEVGPPGARIVDRYRQQPGGAHPLERDLLDAMAASSVGLYLVEAVEARVCQLLLKQLAPAERSVTLIDINMSQMPVGGAVLFSRLLELPQVTMTGGAALMFGAKLEAELTRLWAQSVPRERYRRIFKRHRRQGIPMAYADVANHRPGSHAPDPSDSDE